MLDADVIVFSTGFEGNLHEALIPILGDDVASHLEEWWGIDEEGELRGAYKPSGRKCLFAAAVPYWFPSELVPKRNVPTTVKAKRR